MKKTINYLFIPMLFMLSLASCSKEQDMSIRAPNNAFVSESPEDLIARLAYIVNMDAKDLSIESISYLDVEEGFIAEVEMHTSATDENFNLFYFSPIHKDKISYDGSSIVISEDVEQRNVPYIVGFPGAYCSCGGSGPTSGCKISGHTGGDDKDDPLDFNVYFECYSLGCNNQCTLVRTPAP